MNSNLPVYLQIIEALENDIIAEVYITDALAPSAAQIAKKYAVNPATAIKALGRLAEAGLLYRKRGVGMYLAAGAREKIVRRRKEALLNDTLPALLEEAGRLGIAPEQLAGMLRGLRGRRLHGE